MKKTKILLSLSALICSSTLLAPILTACQKSSIVKKEGAQFSLIKTTNGYCIDGLTNESRSEITEIVVPETINDLPVIEISKGAFKGCTSLKSITLPFIGHTKDAKGCGGLFGYIFGDEMYEGCGAYTWQYFSADDSYEAPVLDYYQFAIPNTLRKVHITSGTTIQSGAFSGCTYLKSITFGSESNSFNATEIGNCAFSGCSSLKSIEIPSNVKIIGREAFANCFNLKEINVPSNVTTIKHNAFKNCISASKANIPSTVVNMGKLVFAGFSGLILAETESVPSSWDAEWAEANASIVYGYTNGGIVYKDNMIVAICGKDSNQYAYIIQWLGKWSTEYDYTIQGTVECNGKTYPIKKLGSNLFLDNTVFQKVTISENIEELGPNCFEGCSNLTTINFPSTLKKIGSNCFVGCHSLNKHTELVEGVATDVDGVYFNQVEEIGSSAFEGLQGLTKITFGDKITTIGNSAFKDCENLNFLRETDNKEMSVRRLFFPKSIKNIGEYAFSNVCKYIPTGEDPETHKQIKLFGNQGDIYFEAGNTNEIEIGVGAFKSAGVRDTGTYPDQISFHIDFNNINIKKFNDSVFEACYLRYLINFPQTVQEIGYRSFYRSYTVYTKENDTQSKDCRLLTLPKTLEVVGKEAFQECSGVGYKFEGADDGSCRLREIGERAFIYCSYNPANDNDDRSNGWYKKLIIPDTVEKIGANAFNSWTGVRTLYISNNEKLTRLESGVFAGMSNLGGPYTDDEGTYHEQFNVEVPANITYLVGSTFSSCRSLKYIRFKGKITYLGSSILSGCAALEHGKAIQGGGTVESIIFDDNFNELQTFNANMYQGCTHLVWAPFPTSDSKCIQYVTSIPSTSFAECEQLSNFNVLDNITSIGNAAFRGCLAMTEITGMNSVKYIYQSAFANCWNLNKFAMPDGCHSIGDGAFAHCTSLGKENDFILPTDIVQKATSSTSRGMGTNPFTGWTADQCIYFRTQNIDTEETAKKTDGSIVLKWGWTLKKAGTDEKGDFYTCANSGSSVVKFRKKS